MAGRFYISQHAIERFRERFAAGLSFNHARRELIAMSSRARKLRHSAHAGGWLYEIGDEGHAKIILVVKFDVGQPGGVVATVLFPEEAEEGGAEVED